MASDTTPRTQKLLAKSAALLVLIAMLTGFLVASAMTGQLHAEAGSLLAAHVNALAGSAWLVALGWSLPMTRFGEVGRKRMALMVIFPCFANWLVTAAKAFFFVKGVGADGNTANNVIFALLGITVVVPSVAAAGVWVYSLFGTAASNAEGA